MARRVAVTSGCGGVGGEDCGSGGRATDDNSFTDAAGANNLLIGKVLDVNEVTGVALVHFEAAPLRSI